MRNETPQQRQQLDADSIAEVHALGTKIGFIRLLRLSEQVLGVEMEKVRRKVREYEDELSRIAAKKRVTTECGQLRDRGLHDRGVAGVREIA